MFHRNSLRLFIDFKTLIFIFFLVLSNKVFCQNPDTTLMDYFPDIVILESNDPAPGYYFFGSKNTPNDSPINFVAIVDNYGTPIFFRLLEEKKSSVRLLEDGRIVFWNGSPRILTFWNEMLQFMDSITTRGYKSDGHDWDISEDGNIILMGKDNHLEDMSTIVPGGLTEVIVGDIVVQEFDKDKNLLYTWKSRDHFDVLDAYGDFYSMADYTSNILDYVHTNSVHFDSDTSFLLSSRHMNEITKVDRRTGDIIWRLGGKNNEFTFINDDLGFSHQHSVSRTPDGTILLFDNGNGRPAENYSSSVEYDLDEVNMTATLLKRFIRNPSIFVAAAGNTQRIHNGNTLTGWNKTLYSATEFHPDGSTAIEISNIKPNRIEKFLWKTQIFETNVDTLDFGTFDGLNPIQKTIEITNNSETEISITSYSTHTEYFELTTPLPINIASHAAKQVDIIFDPSSTDLGYLKDLITLNHDIDTQRIARQVWLFGTQEDNTSPVAEITPSGQNISIDTNLIINLSEPIRILLGEELKYNTIDDYIIFRLGNDNGIDLEFDATINTEKNKIKIIPDEPLLPDQLYYIAIKDYLSDYSDNDLPIVATTFYTGINLTIEDLDKNDIQVMLYPNPNNGKIKIRTKNLNTKLVSIYDLTGRLVYNQVFEEELINIDISGEISGQYILIIQDKNNQILKSIKFNKI